MFKKYLLLFFLCLTSSVTGENSVEIGGSTFVPIIAKRPDLLLGITFSREIVGKLQVSADVDYSFRHQISSSNETVPELLVMQTDSTGQRITGLSEIDVVKYEESGYCFVFRINPKYRINNFLLGLGVGYEFGEYQQKGVARVNGRLPPAFSQLTAYTSNSKLQDNVIQYYLNAAYEIRQYSFGFELNYKSNNVFGIGINLAYSVFRF
jgi:hypothetical protein